MLARILFYYAKALWLKRVIRTPEQLHSYQQKQLKRLINTTLIASPFYRDYVHRPFNEWPVMNKQQMMAHFDTINTQGINKEQAFEVALRAEQTRDFSPLIGSVSVGLSSGTTGTRGLFLADARERDAWAGTILAKVLPNGLRSKERIAFFLRANNNLYTTLNKSRNIQFYFFDLLGDFEKYIQQLNEINPTIISAPASVLLWLASHKKYLTIKPKKIVAVAEVLESVDAQKIAAAFSCIVGQIYQCTEGFLAISDKKTNKLTLNEEFLIIEKEWLDEKRFVPVITDLARNSQPIIRYRLDDVLIYSDKTRVFTELEGIEGRVGDICYGRRDAQLVPIFADTIRQHFVKSMIIFSDYRINQINLNEFTIAITPEPIDKKEVELYLNQIFQQKQCDYPNWIWQTYISEKRDTKNRRIQSEFNPNF